MSFGPARGAIACCEVGPLSPEVLRFCRFTEMLKLGLLFIVLFQVGVLVDCIRRPPVEQPNNTDDPTCTDEKRFSWEIHQTNKKPDTVQLCGQTPILAALDNIRRVRSSPRITSVCYANGTCAMWSSIVNLTPDLRVHHFSNITKLEIE